MLAGIGKSLRLYEMGKKALLRKCENSVCPNSSNHSDRADK
jgi:splicing factor 3B subunit 3